MRHPVTQLQLRAIRDTDLPHIYRALSDPRVIAHYGVSYDTLEACRIQMRWYADIERDGRGHWFIIETTEDGSVLGAIGYNDHQPKHRRADIGYWLYPEVWGKGIMITAMQLFLKHVYNTTSLHRLQAVVEEENRRSARLLERAGFLYEGTARDMEVKNRRFISLANYALLRTDWLAKQDNMENVRQ